MHSSSHPSPVLTAVGLVAVAVLTWSVSAFVFPTLFHASQDRDQDPDTAWEDEEDDLEVPAAYRDPISLGVIYDPVVLCSTGHVYDYHTLRSWFATGNRLCPKSNLEVTDVQVTRLPWLKSEISAWLESQDLEVPPPHDNMKAIQELDPRFPPLLSKVRQTTGATQQWAIVQLHGVWSEVLEQRRTDPNCATLHTLMMEEMMEDLVWLVRHGESRTQGVAAHILMWCDDPEDIQWLVACCLCPSVTLCWSPDVYTQQIGMRLLYNLLMAGGPKARQVAQRLGVVECLSRIIAAPRSKFEGSRDRALESLRLLAEDPVIAQTLKDNITQYVVAIADQDEDRWERRDASSLLLKLGWPQDAAMPFTIRQLCHWSWCSEAWLLRRVDHPWEGYSATETVHAAMVENFKQYTDEQLMSMGQGEGFKELAGEQVGEDQAVVAEQGAGQLAVMAEQGAGQHAEGAGQQAAMAQHAAGDDAVRGEEPENIGAAGA